MGAFVGAVPTVSQAFFATGDFADRGLIPGGTAKPPGKYSYTYFLDLFYCLLSQKYEIHSQ